MSITFQKQSSPRAVPSLKQLCINTIARNINRYLNLNGTPYYHVKRILLLCNSQQLERVEAQNPYIIEDSDEIWKVRCEEDFHYSSDEVQAPDGTFRSQYKLLKADYEERLQSAGQRLRHRYKQFETKKQERKIICLDAPITRTSMFGPRSMGAQPFRSSSIRAAYFQAKQAQRQRAINLRSRLGAQPRPAMPGPYSGSDLARPSPPTSRVQIFSSLSEMIEQERTNAMITRDLQSGNSRLARSLQGSTTSRMSRGMGTYGSGMRTRESTSRKRYRDSAEDALFRQMEEASKCPDEGPRKRPRSTGGATQRKDNVFVPSERDRAASAAFLQRLMNQTK